MDHGLPVFPVVLGVLLAYVGHFAHTIYHRIGRPAPVERPVNDPQICRRLRIPDLDPVLSFNLAVRGACCLRFLRDQQ